MNLTQPRHIIHLGPETFHHEAACQGKQLVQLLRLIHHVHPRLTWYVADVQNTGYQLLQRRQSTPASIGDTAALIVAVTDVDQFESGVFVGIPENIAEPKFRDGGLWTEDDDFADLGDAIVEIRAFDTAYWLIATVDAEVMTRLSLCANIP